MFALLSFVKFLDWNENKIDIIRFLYLPKSSQTDDPGKYKTSSVS